MKYLLILFLLFSLPCQAYEITTARGKVIDIKDGDIVEGITYWQGTIEGLKDVTFKNCIMDRQISKTDVFINCSNITLDGGRYVNVNMPDSFILKNRAINFHKKQYEQDGKTYEEIIYPKGNWKRTYIVEDKNIDIISEEYPTLTKEEQLKIKSIYELKEIPTTKTIKKYTVDNQKEIPENEKTKAIFIDSNNAVITR